MIRFRVLGRVGVTVGNESPVLRPRVGALLGLMLLEPNRVWSTDVLIDRLWSGEPPRTAETALRVHLSTLRAALRPGPDAPSRLARVGHGYSVILQPGELDVARFDDALRGALAGPERATTIERLRRELAGWAGEPFEGLDDIDGVIAHRRALLRRHADACVVVAQADVAAGRTAEVLAGVPAQLRIHPTCEPLLGMLAAAQYQAGDQVGALRTVRDFVEHLVGELGLDPTPELVRLEHDILGHAEWLQRPHPGGGPTRGTTTDEDLPDRRALVDELLDELRSPATRRMTHLVGEAGIGKSTLLHQLVTELRADGRQVLHVTAGAGRLALAAVELIARDLGVTWQAGERSAAERAADLVTRLRDAPVTMAIDDADTLDPDSAATLTLVAAACPEVHWLTSGRTSAGLAGQLYGDVGSSARLAVVAIPPLTESDARLLARSWVGSRLTEIDESTIDDAVRRADGNPFLVTALSRAIGAGEAPAVPAATVDHARRQLGLLSGIARQLVERAALDPTDTIDVAALADSMETSRERGVAGVEEAMAVGLVHDSPAGPCFRHALIRESIAESMTTARRALHHAALATTLVNRRAAGASRTAHHLRRAADPALRPAAAEWTARAGEELAQRGALLTAAESYELAASLGAEAQIDPQVTVPWELAAVRLHHLAGRTTHSITLAGEVARRARPLGRADLFASAAIASAGMQLTVGPAHELAIEMISDAWHMVDRADRTTRIALAEAACRVVATDIAPAAERLQGDVLPDLERASEDAGDPRSTALANLGLRVISWKLRARPSERVRRSAAAVAASRRLADATLVLRSHRALVSDRFAMADRSTSEALQSYLRVAQESHSAFHTWDAYRLAAAIAHCQGDDSTADQHVRTADRYLAAIDPDVRDGAALEYLVADHLRHGTLADLYGAATPTVFDPRLDVTVQLATSAVSAAAGQPSPSALVDRCVDEALHGSARVVTLVFASLALDPADPDGDAVAARLAEELTPLAGSLALVEGGTACLGPVDQYLMHLAHRLRRRDLAEACAERLSATASFAAGWATTGGAGHERRRQSGQADHHGRATG